MSNLDTQLIVSRIKEMIKGDGFVPLHQPTFKGNEKTYVNECIDTGWVSSVGSYVDKFEHDLAAYIGVKRAVAVVNGTAALHVALNLVGVKENDEVLIPALTFIATANAVTYCNAIPHFVDISNETLGIDSEKLDNYLRNNTISKQGHIYNEKTGRRVKAIIPMHTFGHPVDMDSLLQVAEKYHLEIVEDAAESLGSYYKGVHTGNFGKVAAMSFNGNKIITTGGGGAILTNDELLANHAKHITTTAKIPHPYNYVHDEIGFNYRMPNINAALGCAQLELLPEFLENKRELTNKYKSLFEEFEGISLFQEPSNSKSNYWLQVVLLDEENIHLRNGLLEQLNENGIMSRPVWHPLNTLSMFSKCPSMNLEVTNSVVNRIINIPSSPDLGRK